jgi:hypothetical protein
LLKRRGRRWRGTLSEKDRKEKEGRTVRKGEEGEGGTHCYKRRGWRRRTNC